MKNCLKGLDEQQARHSNQDVEDSHVNKLQDYLVVLYTSKTTGDNSGRCKSICSFSFPLKFHSPHAHHYGTKIFLLSEAFSFPHLFSLSFSSFLPQQEQNHNNNNNNMMMMMEFLQELLLTAFISIVFAFFLAKLISLSSSPDLDQDLAQRLISVVDPSQFSLSAEKTVTQSIHELKCDGEVSINNEDEPEMKLDGQEFAIVRERDGVELEERLVKDVEFCRELVKRGIGFEIALDSDRIEVKEGLGEGNGAEFLKSGDLDVEEAKDEKKSERDGEFDVGLVKDEFEAKEEKKSERDGEFDVGSVEEASRSDVNEFKAKEGKKTDENDEIDVELVKEAAKEEKRSEIDGEFDLGLLKKEVGFTRSNVADKEIAIEKSDLFDDEWEGIERSELEKRFAAMASRVALGGGDVLSKLGSDVEMQLYGLHKVATEGPCYEPQPSMLKVFARAKWVESCYV